MWLNLQRIIKSGLLILFIVDNIIIVIIMDIQWFTTMLFCDILQKESLQEE